MQESENLRVAQARYTAEREARDEVLADVEQVKDEHARAAQEIDRLRRALDSDRTLMSEFSDRLREEQQDKAKLQSELDRALDAHRQAEQRLELLTETARRRADDELGRRADAEAALREALAERDALAAQVTSLSADDGRGRDRSGTVADLENLVSELESALPAERDRTDAAVNHAAELTEEIDAMHLRREDELRSISVVEQLEAELEGAVAAHGAAVDRVRAIDEERSLLEARIRELTEAHAELMGKVEILEREFDTTMRERDSLLEEVNELRTGRAGDLAAAREGSKSEVRELEHLLTVAEVERDSLVQEASELRQQLQSLAKVAQTASESDDHQFDELEARLGDAIAVRDTYAKQVRELEASLAQSSERREEALRQASDLERALSQEQLRVQEAEVELRRLRAAASADAPAARAGRAEPAVTPPPAAPVAPPRAAPVAAPAPEPEPEPEPEPPAAELPPAPVVRRSAFAELHSIASIEDEGFRRRR